MNELTAIQYKWQHLPDNNKPYYERNVIVIKAKHDLIWAEESNR